MFFRVRALASLSAWLRWRLLLDMVAGGMRLTAPPLDQSDAGELDEGKEH